MAVPDKVVAYFKVKISFLLFLFGWSSSVVVPKLCVKGFRRREKGEAKGSWMKQTDMLPWHIMVRLENPATSGKTISESCSTFSAVSSSWTVHGDAVYLEETRILFLLCRLPCGWNWMLLKGCAKFIHVRLLGPMLSWKLVEEKALQLPPSREEPILQTIYTPKRSLTKQAPLILSSLFSL